MRARSKWYSRRVRRASSSRADAVTPPVVATTATTTARRASRSHSCCRPRGSSCSAVWQAGSEATSGWSGYARTAAMNSRRRDSRSRSRPAPWAAVAVAPRGRLRPGLSCRHSRRRTRCRRARRHSCSGCATAFRSAPLSWCARARLWRSSCVSRALCPAPPRRPRRRPRRDQARRRPPPRRHSPRRRPLGCSLAASAARPSRLGRSAP